MLGAALRQNDHRADHLRATLSVSPDGLKTATPFEKQDSATQRLLAAADALILRPPHAPALKQGAMVEVVELKDFGL